MATGLLVSYAGYPYTLSSLFPDNGLASLAAVLRQEGHEVTILDYNTTGLMERLIDEDNRMALKELFAGLEKGADEDGIRRLVAISHGMEPRAREVAAQVASDLVDTCRRHRVDFVGFKLWSGDGFEASVQIAEHLRAELPRIKLFAGGPAVHYSGWVAAAEAPVFDAVIDGDGEDAIRELALYAEGKRSLDGVPNRLDPGAERTTPLQVVDLRSLPVPEYGADVYPALARGEKLKLFSIDESRGCPMQCAFCINWCIEGARWRTRSPEQVLAEIKSLTRDQKSRCFRLAGTYSPPAMVQQICEGILEDGLNVEFGLYLHGLGVSESLLELMRRAGAYGVFVGVESGSDLILKKSMNKHIDVESLRKVLKACLKAGLYTAGSFIFPAPFETPETERETKAFIQDVFMGQEKGLVALTFPGLIPGTPWWNERERYGFELTVDDVTYRRQALRFKIKHLIPPSLWTTMQYQLNHVDQRMLLRRTTELQTWATSLGMTVNLADYDAHVGEKVGVKAQDFKKDIAGYFFSGDAPAISKLVRDFNQRVYP